MAYRNWAVRGTESVATESMISVIQPALDVYDNSMQLINRAKAAIVEIENMRSVAMESFHHADPSMSSQTVSKIVEIAKANGVTIHLASTESYSANIEQRFDMIREVESVAIEGLTARIGALFSKAKNAISAAFKSLFDKTVRTENSLNKLKSQLTELNSTEVQHLDITRANSGITTMCRYDIDVATKHMAECEKFFMFGYNYKIDDDGLPAVTNWKTLDRAVLKAIPKEFTKDSLKVSCIPGNVFMSFSQAYGKAQVEYSTAKYMEADVPVLKEIAESSTFKVDGKEVMDLVNGGLHVVETVYRSKDKWSSDITEHMAEHIGNDVPNSQEAASVIAKAMLLSYANCIDGTQAIAKDYIKAIAK